jgi:hypothetical protein
MIRNKVVGWMTLVLIGLAGANVWGQEETAAELYGQGVHAYFGNDFETAASLLTQSIEKNKLDPRAYYFRGLALANLHGIDSGLVDMAQGAEIEVNKMDQKIYNVSGALQRIQGTLRLELEKQRKLARLQASDRKKKQDRIRYERIQRRDDIVLIDPDRPASQVKLDLPKPDLGGQQDPFQTGIAFSGGDKVNYQAPAPVEPGSDDAMPATQGAEGQQRDPFSDPIAKTPEDPFASPSDDANPFGDATPAPKTRQAEAEPKDVNPFGDATPAPKTPQAEAAPKDVNPFGDDMPAVDPKTSPLFEESRKPSAIPGGNVPGALLDLLGKTLSGSSPDRDPFSDAPVEKGAKKEAEPAPEKPEAPSEDPRILSGTLRRPRNRRPRIATTHSTSPASEFGIGVSLFVALASSRSILEKTPSHYF